MRRQWLRWYDAQGNWIPTPTEAAQQQAETAQQQAEAAQQRVETAEQQAETAQQQAEVAQQQAEAAEQRAETAERAQKEAISRLLGMGLSAQQVAEALGVPIEEVNG